MPSWVSPETWACSAARRIGLPWPSRTPWRTSTKSRCASIWIQVDRRLAGEGTDAGDVDRMVAAEDQRQRPPLQDLAHRQLGVAMAGGGVGVHHVGVADVDDPDLVGGEIDRVVLMVVGPAVAEREQGRCLADRPRTEPGAGAVLRPHVVRYAQDRHVGIERVPLEAGRPLAESAVPDERQIEASALVGMHGGLRSRSQLGPDRRGEKGRSGATLRTLRCRRTHRPCKVPLRPDQPTILGSSTSGHGN